MHRQENSEKSRMNRYLPDHSFWKLLPSGEIKNTNRISENLIQELNQNSFMFFSRKNGQSREKREKLTDTAEYNLGNVFVSTW